MNLRRSYVYWLALYIFCIFWTSCTSSKLNKTKEVIYPTFTKILTKYQVTGTIVIYDQSRDIYYSNDFEWANTGFLPASTFKIPNSIISLELGVMASDSTIIPWDGQKRYLPLWEQDLMLRDAFKVSCVPCYQEIAKKIGVERMQKFLKKLKYPGMVFDASTIHNFWLEGNSRITPMEQIDFLKQLYHRKIPISDITAVRLKSMMKMENINNDILYGKTGYSTSIRDNGWFVGYNEVAGNVYYFATNIVPNVGTSNADFIAARLRVTKDALLELKSLHEK